MGPARVLLRDGGVRIAYLLEGTVLCGGVKVVLDHGRLLGERGHAVVVVSKEPAPDWYELPFEFRQVAAFEPGALPAADVVVATYWTTVEPAYRAGRGVPLHLCQGYEGDFPENRPARAAIEAAYRLPVAKFAVSAHLAAVIRERFGQPCAVVGQGIDLQRFAPAPDSRPWATGAPAGRILLVGPLEVAWKGIRDGLEAVRRVKRRRSDVRLVRVSQLAPSVEEERAAGVVDEYHCRVRPSEMPALYRSCDVFLSPSREQEGFGLPALEALACGVPAVLTSIPSYLGLAPSRDFALFVPPGDPEAMARALMRLLDDRVLADDLARRGRRVAEEFSLDRLADRLEGVLLDASRAGRPAPGLPVGG